MREYLEFLMLILDKKFSLLEGNLRIFLKQINTKISLNPILSKAFQTCYLLNEKKNVMGFVF